MVGFIEIQQLCYISHFMLYLTQTGEGQGTIKAGGAGLLYSPAPVVE